MFNNIRNNDNEKKRYKEKLDSCCDDTITEKKLNKQKKKNQTLPW